MPVHTGIIMITGKYKLGVNRPSICQGDPETAWSGIGQSTDLICPYSMLRFVSAIANDGVLVEPKLIDDGQPPRQSLLINPETAKTMQELMRNNVVTVYGDNRFPGLTVCGKTGTADGGSARYAPPLGKQRPRSARFMEENE